MKYVSSSIRKFVCRWIGVLLILVPFIGVPKSWKDSIILIFAIVLLFASFSFDEKQKQSTSVTNDSDDSDDDEFDDEEMATANTFAEKKSDAYGTLDERDIEEDDYVDNDVVDDEYEQRPL